LVNLFQLKLVVGRRDDFGGKRLLAHRQAGSDFRAEASGMVRAGEEAVAKLNSVDVREARLLWLARS